MWQWTRIISERNVSGKTVKNRCEEQGIKPKSYYWQKRIRESLIDRLARAEESANLPSTESKRGVLSHSRFAEITQRGKEDDSRYPAVTIDLCGMVVAVHKGADQATVRNVLLAVKSL